MKLQVNLIAVHERRSAAPVSIRVIIAALALLAIGGILITVGIKFFTVLELNTQYDQVQRLTAELKQRETGEKSRDVLLSRARAHAEEFSFWLDARHRWSRPLHAIARSTPAEIQIERLQLRDSILARNGKLRRSPQLTLQCRIEAASPLPVIQAFQAFLTEKSGDLDSMPENYRPLPGAPDQPPTHGFSITLRFPSPEAPL